MCSFVIKKMRVGGVRCWSGAPDSGQRRVRDGAFRSLANIVGAGVTGSAVGGGAADGVLAEVATLLGDVAPETARTIHVGEALLAFVSGGIAQVGCALMRLVDLARLANQQTAESVHTLECARVPVNGEAIKTSSAGAGADGFLAV